MRKMVSIIIPYVNILSVLQKIHAMKELLGLFELRKEILPRVSDPDAGGGIEGISQERYNYLRHEFNMWSLLLAKVDEDIINKRESLLNDG